MKAVIVFLLMTSIANAKTVKAKFEEGGWSSLCLMNDSNVDYPSGVLELQKDAESQCHGPAVKVSDVKVSTRCVDLRVWGAVSYSVAFSADYECK